MYSMLIVIESAVATPFLPHDDFGRALGFYFCVHAHNIIWCDTHSNINLYIYTISARD